MLLSVISVCGLLAAAIAAPTSESKRHVVHERRDNLPSHWKRSVKLPADAFLPMRIALTQRNLDQAYDFLMDVSHPESPNYGKHWSPKKVAETFAPSKEAYASVVDWLSEAGVVGSRVKQSQSLNWIHADVTVAEAEGLLKTKFYEYTHSATGQVHVACEEYSIPEEIRDHVDFVTPTVHFDAKIDLRKKRRSLSERQTETSTVGHQTEAGAGRQIGSPGDGSLPKEGAKVPSDAVHQDLKNCDTAITPACLRALYEVPTNPRANSKSKLPVSTRN